MESWRRRLRRVLSIAAAILVFVILAGATYQGVTTAIERRQFPHPGRLVDVGGHQLHIHCLGQGAPTVVLEAPATGLSAVWGWIQPRVAEVTRVCGYDRAGLGWSEASDAPFDPMRVPDELHALLNHAGERAPFVVAGHGLGAAFARLYASRYRGEVAALVLVEPGDGSRADQERMTRLLGVSPWLARAGMLRAADGLARHADGLPGTWGGATRAFLNRPDHLTRAAEEMSLARRTAAQASTVDLDPQLPLIEVRPTGDGPFAELVSRDQAERVTAAVLQAVARVRSR